MSKYTTEVRYICENAAGLKESVGADKVDTVIAAAWNKVFTSKVEFFDESYRRLLCSKILKHYYMREIGAETVGIWKLWMNTKLEEIMPYYNQLYLSARKEFDPFKDVDYTREYSRQTEGTSKSEQEGSGGTTSKRDASRDETGSVTTKNTNAFSDTPQGGIGNVESMAYLTNATVVNETDSTTGHVTDGETGNTSYNDSKSDSSEVDNHEEYLERVTGKRGGENYPSLLQKFRETFLNIDMLVVGEFEELFMMIW